MDCKTVSMYRTLEKLAIKQVFKQEPTTKLSETTDERIGDSTSLMTIPKPETCESVDIQA